jgi:predicted transcriptional regulator
VSERKSKYRSRTDIIASVLRAIDEEKGEAGITRLMYNSFLSYHQLKDYLKLLKNNALLDYNTRNRKFSITAKGLKFLNLYDKMDDILHVSGR